MENSYILISRISSKIHITLLYLFHRNKTVCFLKLFDHIHNANIILLFCIYRLYELKKTLPGTGVIFTKLFETNS